MSAQEVSDSILGLSPTGRRVCRISINGKTAWMKDFDVPSPSKWGGVQKALFLVTRMDLLRPVPSVSGAAGAVSEAEAMVRFRAIGVHVPELVWARGARIVVSDIGETLRDIERRGGAATVEELARKAAAELGRIHTAGLVHGRPILRNMTWDGRTIGFIDFEEQPLAVMSRDAAQSRDVLLFLISLGRRNEQAVVSAALQAYRARMPAPLEAEFSRLARFARPLTGRLGDVMIRSDSRDLAGLVRSMRAVQRIAI